MRQFGFVFLPQKERKISFLRTVGVGGGGGGGGEDKAFGKGLGSAT